MLEGKKILLGVTGGIAAYKAAALTRLLIKAGAEVQVIMTPEAAAFITPLTLSTLSKRPVLQHLVHEGRWNNHVDLGRWADILLIAPATANTLAKMTAGLCDNLLMAVYLSAACPVVAAPAMDEDMWKHTATRRNIATLEQAGNIILPVESGELASGFSGAGRMSEPATIVAFLTGFRTETRHLEGKKVLITAGPTFEPIDPVRFIGNRSSGKMGLALAEEMALQGAAVELVLGPSGLSPGHPAIRVKRVETAAEMFNACTDLFPATDIAVLAAAVADYKPAAAAPAKIKKKEEKLTLVLEKNPDILKTLGKNKRNDQFLAGFALETDHEEENALKKLREKNLDLIVLNSLREEGAGFMHDTNKATLYSARGEKLSLPLKSKKALAKDIVKYIIALLEKNNK